VVVGDLLQDEVHYWAVKEVILIAVFFFKVHKHITYLLHYFVFDLLSFVFHLGYIIYHIYLISFC
jgi:hypothetical protein